MRHFLTLHRVQKTHMSGEARLIFMSPGNPEAADKAQVDTDTHEALTKQMEARLRSPEGVQQARDMRTQQAGKEAARDRESIQKGVQSAATAEYASLTQPPNDTADGRQAAVKAVTDALQGIADVVPTATGVTITLRAGAQLAPVAAGTEATDAQLKQVAEKDRTALRVQLNQAMEGMPANLRQAVTTTLDSLTNEDVQRLPALLKQIRDEPTNQGPLAVRVAMSLTPQVMGEDQETRTNSIRALRGPNGQPVATGAQAEAISAFIERLSPEQRTLITSLRAGMATIESTEAQQTADKQLLDQVRSTLPRPMPALGTGARAMLEARLQMSGIDVEASNLDAVPADLRVFGGQPMDRALNRFMGMIAIFSAIGGGNRREANTKVAAAPTALESAAKGALENGTKLLRDAAPTEVRPGPPALFIFNQAAPPCTATFRYDTRTNEWQAGGGPNPTNFVNIRRIDFFLRSPAADLSDQARLESEPFRAAGPNIRTLITSLTNLGDNVAVAQREQMTARIAEINPTLNGVALSVISPQSGTVIAIGAPISNSGPFRLPDNTLKTLQTEFPGRVRVMGTQPDGRYVTIFISSPSPADLETVARLMPRLS